MVTERKEIQIYKCLAVLVNTPHYEVAKQLVIAQLKLSEPDAEKLLQEAKAGLLRAAEIHREGEFALAVQTLRELLAKNIKIKDYKTVLAVRKELSRLLRLYDQAKVQEMPDFTEPEGETLAAIREHLEPLGLAPEGTDIVELVRLAVIQLTEK